MTPATTLEEEPACILVVDDNKDVRDGLCELLACEGYAVREAGDGGEALAELATNGPPDLVLLDLRMPNMDGYEFLERKAAEGIEKVPVIVVSASLEEPLPYPVAAVFRKPVEVDLLLGAVRREVEKRGPH
jgi:CheY-like chemotaxis protein